MKNEQRAAQILNQASCLGTQLSNMLQYLRDDQTNETWQKVFDSDLIVALKRIEIIEKECKAIILPESA